MNVCGNESMCASEPPLIAHNSYLKVDQNLMYEFDSTFSSFDHQNFNSATIHSFGPTIVKQNQSNQNSIDINFECEQSFKNQYFNPHKNVINHGMPNYTSSQSQEPNLIINNANTLELDPPQTPQTCNACSAILEADMPCLQLSDECHL